MEQNKLEAVQVAQDKETARNSADAREKKALQLQKAEHLKELNRHTASETSKYIEKVE